MVVRDNGGNVKFAATKLDNIRVSLTMAEIIALRWGFNGSYLQIRMAIS